MSAPDGYYLMSRGWMDHPVFGVAEYSERDAWVWLIEQAAYKPTRARIKGANVDLERGQLCFAQRFLADRWRWSKSRADRFLKKLVAEGMIKTCTKIGATAGHAAGQGQSIITICNYDKYQPSQKSERGNDGTEAGQQRGNSGANKNERNEGNEKLAAREADILGFVGEVARAAGVASVDQGRIAEQNLIVRKWIDAGADQGLILKTIERCAASAKQTPRFLRYFDGAVLEAIAANHTKSNEANTLMDRIIAGRKAA